MRDARCVGQDGTYPSSFLPGSGASPIDAQLMLHQSSVRTEDVGTGAYGNPRPREQAGPEHG